MNHSRLFINLILFLSLCLFALSLAANRPLWNDEIYSQKTGVESLNYLEMFAGKIHEGNNSPLFYAIQKTICKIFSYSSPESMSTQFGEYYEWHAQIILRLLSVFSFALAMVILFDFFAVHFSLGWGLYSLAIFLTSFMIWPYWPEARPYAFWALLGTIQTVLLLNILRRNPPRESLLNNLIVTHLLLSLTAVISSVQIVTAGIILYFFGIRRWSFYFWGLVAPLSIITYHHSQAMRFNFFFNEAPWHLIAANISAERLILIIIFSLSLLMMVLKSSTSRTLNDFKLETIALTNLLLLLLMSVAIFILLKIKENPINSFQVSNRYFIFLLPAGIAAVTLSSRGLIKLCGNKKLLKIGAFLLLAALIYYRFQKTLPFTLKYF